MPIYELFSQRRRRELGQTSDVFQYDEVPQELRVQMVHIWKDTIGDPNSSFSDDRHTIRGAYLALARILRREYGVFALSPTRDPEDRDYAFGEVAKFFLEEKNTDHVLDAIELSLRVIEKRTSQWDYLHRSDAKEVAADAIDEFNHRAKEAGFGYSYSDGQLIRIDTTFTHKEVVQPALVVLRRKGFEGAQKEFLKAHEHFRHGRRVEALVECLKAFESVMKVICNERGWQFDPTKGAKELVRACFDNGLIPAYWQTHFAGLRSVLESAIPTPRNKQGGHGAGAAPAQPPPEELVSYVLHMTAATILFLTEAEAKLP